MVPRYRSVTAWEQAMRALICLVPASVTPDGRGTCAAEESLLLWFLLRSLDSVVIAVCVAGTLGSCAGESAKSGFSGHTSVSAG
jgi:hypothetical protein